MMGQPTYAEIRHLLGFGPRRLKIMLALTRHPELDSLEWAGTITFFLGRTAAVKYDVHEGTRPAPTEVGLDDAA
jgi:hypothetical protein